MDEERMIDLVMLGYRLHKLVNSVKVLHDHFNKWSDSYSTWLDNFIKKTNDLKIPGKDYKMIRSEEHSDKNRKYQWERTESPPPRRIVTPSAPTLSEILELVEGNKKMETPVNVFQGEKWMFTEHKRAEEKLTELLKSMEPRKIGILLQTLRPSDWKEILSQPPLGIVNSFEKILSGVQQSDWKSSEPMQSELDGCTLEGSLMAKGIRQYRLSKGSTTNDGIASSASTITGGSGYEYVGVKNEFIGILPESEQLEFIGTQPESEPIEFIGIQPESEQRDFIEVQLASEQREDVDECFAPQWVFPAMNEEMDFPAFNDIKDIQVPLNLLQNVETDSCGYHNHPANEICGSECIPVFRFDPEATAREMCSYGGIPMYEIMPSFNGVGTPLLDEPMDDGVM